MKKVFVSFALSSSLLLSNLSAVTADYLKCEEEVVNVINDEEFVKTRKNDISKMILVLEESTNEFNSKVLNYLFTNYEIWIKENDINLIGQNLTLVIKYIKKKEKMYKEAIRIFRKDNELRKHNPKLIELNESNVLLKEKIQNLIDLTYMGIEAKHIFKLI